MKSDYYWAELRAALTTGKWSAPYPGKTPTGKPLSWSELLRKFNKHCKGFTDVAEVANYSQNLALLIEWFEQPVDGSSEVDLRSALPLELRKECQLPEERLEEITDSYRALKNLRIWNDDTLNFLLAYYAYGLGRPFDCLAHLADIRDIVNFPARIPTSESISNAPSSHFIGGDASITSSITNATIVSPHANQIKDGTAWAMVETVRSICLQGMAKEHLTFDHPQVLETYCTALPLLSVIETQIASIPIPTPVPTSAGHAKYDFPSFTCFQELWRWVERLLWRAIILAARLNSNPWTWLSHYTTCSRYWPANFRALHRSTINTIHLRALVLSPPGLPASSRDSSKSSSWLQAARTAVNEYRAILTVSTSFPRAGQRNVRVEEFVDLCVAIWEASGGQGDHAGWVIEILWWATRLTFNSHRILRHMSRLFYVSGDVDLAKRTLRLYVQVMSKAFETGSIGMDPLDSDINRRWVETLTQGARMMCRLASAPDSGMDGLKEAREAGELLEKARTRLDPANKVLAASIYLAEGIWHSIMALKEFPETRPERDSQCLESLSKSIEQSPSASGYYHLALALARPGASQDLEEAIVNAGLAVEAEPKEIRHWHLLALILTKREKWTAAKGALEEGAALGEEDAGTAEISTDGDMAENRSKWGRSTASLSAPEATATGPMHERVESFTHHKKPDVPATLSQPVIDIDATEFRPAWTLLAPFRDRPLPSPAENNEYSLQLRITQVALMESMEGPESAGTKCVELFKWIAGRKGHGHDHNRSLGQSGITVTLKSPSEMIVPLGHEKEKDSLANVQRPSTEVVPISSPSNYTLTMKSNIVRTSSPEGIHPTVSKNDDHGRFLRKRSSSTGEYASKGRRVQRMLKNRVHKSQATITTNIKRLGAVRSGGMNLRRSLSAPDFHFPAHHYQASSIHSRKRLSSFIRPHHRSTQEPPFPAPPSPILPPVEQQTARVNNRKAKEDRLLSNLWLMSAATFRRQGKIEQAKAAIQEAEVRDEGNPNVWTQLGLYYLAFGHDHNAMDSFHKALFISPDDISATVHLCRLYLSTSSNSVSIAKSTGETDPSNVDLAAGMLSDLTRGAGWDSAEAWYYLAKAYGLQGRKDREHECLRFALKLSEQRGLRDIGVAIGHCL